MVQAVVGKRGPVPITQRRGSVRWLDRWLQHSGVCQGRWIAMAGGLPGPVDCQGPMERELARGLLTTNASTADTAGKKFYRG